MEKSYMEMKWMASERDTKVKQKYGAKRRYTSEEPVMQIKKKLKVTCLLISYQSLNTWKQKVRVREERRKARNAFPLRKACLGATPFACSFDIWQDMKDGAWGTPSPSWLWHSMQTHMMTEGSSTTYLVSPFPFFFFEPLVSSEAMSGAIVTWG